MISLVARLPCYLVTFSTLLRTIGIQLVLESQWFSLVVLDVPVIKGIFWKETLKLSLFELVSVPLA